METVSLLNLGFFAKLATIVDIIPKLIYFLYACLASGVDALQALVRKLAGLDVYYQATTGEAVTNTDPLTEFVYGILGFGESAPIYEALNTVFWSFAIFGLIVLAVSTMAAIIKSHYSEDSSGTSPWKYIYTAAKAIFTFAIVPVLVIIGLQISSFVLRTLDNITAGSGSEEEIVSMFGRSAVAKFKSEQVEGTDTVTYAYYDFFGAGAPSTTTTFSGLLFKASAYSCNRARTDSYTVNQLQGFLGGGIFGNDESEFPDSGTNDEKLEYIAGQIDYLFANNIHLVSDYSYWQVVSESQDVAPVWSVTDVTGFGKSVVGSFSKYDVSFIWVFYNLWTFNFIIGFVGVFVTFGIMISIILGMMSRLIKGAALFLVYPALLGIAPLDNFKAFKSWGTQFMQQLMMAFGSILGINLLMLVLPYVQNINFFNIGVIDTMVQLIMLIAGLLMAKDFISMINGFVGGADAASAGEGAKGSIGGKLKAGIKPAAAIAGAGVRVAGRAGLAVGKAGLAAGKAGKGLAKSIALRTSAKRANKAQAKLDKFNNEDNKKKINKKRDKALNKLNEENLDKKSKLSSVYTKAFTKAKKQGYTEEDAIKLANKAKQDEDAKISKNYLKKKKKIYDSGFEGTIKAKEAKINRIATNNGLAKNGETGQYEKTMETHNKAKENLQNTGKAVVDGFKGASGEMAAAGKSLADGFLKALKGLSGAIGLDKTIAGAKEVFGESLTMKGGVFEERKKKSDEKEEKDKVKAKEDTAAAQTTAQTSALEKIAETMDGLLKETKGSAEASRATTKAVQALSDSLKSGGSTGSSSDSSSSGGTTGSGS